MNLKDGRCKPQTRRKAAKAKRQQSQFFKAHSKAKSVNITHGEPLLNLRPRFLAPEDPRLEGNTELSLSTISKRFWDDHGSRKQATAMIQRPTISDVFNLKGSEGKEDSSQATSSTKSGKSIRQTKLGEFKHLAPVVNRLKSLGNVKSMSSRHADIETRKSKSKRLEQTRLDDFNELAPIVKRLESLSEPKSEPPKLINPNKVREIHSRKAEKLDIDNLEDSISQGNQNKAKGLELIDLTGLDDEDDDTESLILESIMTARKDPDLTNWKIGQDSAQANYSSKPPNHIARVHDSTDMREKRHRLLQQPDWAGLDFSQPLHMTFPESRDTELSQFFKGLRYPKGRIRRKNASKIRIKQHKLPTKRHLEEEPMMSGALQFTQSDIKVKIGDDALKSTQYSLPAPKFHSPPPSSDSMLLDEFLNVPQSSHDLLTINSLARDGKVNKRSHEEYNSLDSINPFKSTPSNYLSHRCKLVDDEDLIQECQELESLPESPQVEHIDKRRLIFESTPSLSFNPPPSRNKDDGIPNSHGQSSFEKLKQRRSNQIIDNDVHHMAGKEAIDSLGNVDIFKPQPLHAENALNKNMKTRIEILTNTEANTSASWRNFVTESSDEVESTSISGQSQTKDASNTSSNQNPEVSAGEKLKFSTISQSVNDLNDGCLIFNSPRKPDSQTNHCLLAEDDISIRHRTVFENQPKYEHNSTEKISNLKLKSYESSAKNSSTALATIAADKDEFPASISFDGQRHPIENRQVQQGEDDKSAIKLIMRPVWRPTITSPDQMVKTETERTAPRAVEQAPWSDTRKLVSESCKSGPRQCGSTGLSTSIAYTDSIFEFPKSDDNL